MTMECLTTLYPNIPHCLSTARHKPLQVLHSIGCVCSLLQAILSSAPKGLVRAVQICSRLHIGIQLSVQPFESTWTCVLGVLSLRRAVQQHTVHKEAVCQNRACEYPHPCSPHLQALLLIHPDRTIQAIRQQTSTLYPYLKCDLCLWNRNRFCELY